MSENLFGAIVATEDVIDSAVETLRVWLPTYLAELEHKHKLRHLTITRPPTPESYHGGADFESWIGAASPEIMVVAKPTGEPERNPHIYTQGYRLEVGALVVGKGSELAERAEDEARILASYLGACCQLLVQQSKSMSANLHAATGGYVERLFLAAAPEMTLPDPEIRNICQTITGFEVYVTPIMDEAAGPVGETPKESPGYEGPEEPFKDAGEVETHTVTVVGEPIDKPL